MKCLRVSAVCKAVALAAVSVLALSGCAGVFHDSIVGNVKPVTVPPPAPALADGSIFQGNRSNRALFEDLRPHRVGDLLTVLFDEQVSASKRSQSSANRSSKTSFSPDLVPAGLERLGDYGMDIKSGTDFKGGGATSAGNTFTGTLTVTVVKVLGNGNLRVRGEKQIAINKGTEFIRFSGTVDPRHIGTNNSVLSTRVADARIEYVGDGYISDAQRMGWLQHLMLDIWPF
ncbi:MAG TPA: flagellar basal body L-ring protein FlgH [Oleiagrimonas sp.]|nr:flagellar basal body L-ring protein FlgH [Oleiagrimonas sp.]